MRKFVRGGRGPLTLDKVAVIIAVATSRGVAVRYENYYRLLLKLNARAL